MSDFKQILNSAFVKKIFKSFTIYTSANFINQAIPFLLLPILTRFLSSRDYGVLATFLAIMGITTVIISMGTTGAVVRGYFDREKNNFNFFQYTSNAIVINFVSFLILLIILLFSKSFVSEKLSIPANWLLLLPVIGLCAAVYSIPSSLFVFKQKPLPFATLKVSNTFVEMMLSIFFIVVLGFNWQGRVLGITINRILFLIIGIFLLFRNKSLVPSINYKYIKDILHFGIPIVLHSLSLVMVIAIDRFFLNTFAGFSVTGLYSVAYSIVSIIGFFIGAFSLAWSPILYEKLGRTSEILKIKLVGFTYVCFILILLGALLFVVISPFLIKIFIGKNFYGAYQFIFWLALGFAFHGMYVMVAQYIFYKKKTYLAGVIAIITIILCIASNYVFIKLHGPIGIAQATCLVFLSRFLLFWYFSNKVYPMPWFSFIKKYKNIKSLIKT